MSATLDTLINNPNVRKMLSLIANTEGTDRLHSYYTNVGGKKIEDVSRHPNVVGMRTKEGPSTAFGRYQVTNTTYKDIAPKIGVKDMSPESQDKIAVALMKRSGALDDVVSGKFGKAIEKLGGTWASLPSSPYSQPKKSWADVNKILGSNYKEPGRTYTASGNKSASGEVPSSGTYTDEAGNVNPMSNIHSTLDSLRPRYNLAEGSNIPRYMSRPEGLAFNLNMPMKSKQDTSIPTGHKGEKPKFVSKPIKGDYSPEDIPSILLAQANPDLGLALKLAAMQQQMQ